MVRRSLVVLVCTLLLGAGMVISTPSPVDAEVAGALDPTWATRSIMVGGGQACAISDDGRLRCWGFNDYGQLGLGDTEQRGDEPGEMGSALPVVDLGPGRTATQVSGGPDHVCALLDDGSVKCWGNNNFGQLGLGDLEARGDEPGEMGSSLPAVDLGPGRTATAISAGYSHTCALLDDGSVKCWGLNNDGQLGQGDTAHRGDGPGEMGAALLPIDIGAGRTAVAISAGAGTTCAIRDDHALACWGQNAAGKLGLGYLLDAKGDQPGEMGANVPLIDVGPGRTTSAVSVGRDHSCAILDDHSVKCWGLNDGGALGLGDLASRGDGPNEMGANLPAVDLGPGRSATAISAGYSLTCAVLDDSSLRCWGKNEFGRLGLGDTADRGDQPGEMGAALPPVELGGPTAAVSVGTITPCAVLTGGGVKCWLRLAGQGDTAIRGDQPGEMGANLPAVPLGPSPAPVLRADYRFLRSRLSSVAGAPNLLDVGPGTNVWARERVAAPLRSVLQFPRGNGIDVPTLSTVVPDDLYTIALLFRVDALDNPDETGYERLVQWTDDASEAGLYLREGRMNFYSEQVDEVTDEASGETVDVDEWVQVVVTRSRIGRLRVYLDGVPALDLSDDAREGVVTADDVLRFFRDDTEEDTSGAVSRIRLWDRPLSAAVVGGLTELPPGPTVTRSRPAAAQQTTVRVTGNHFGPLEQVRLTIRDRRGVTRTLGIPRTNRAGYVTRQVVIPGALVDGAARITATGLVSQLARSVGVTIL